MPLWWSSSLNNDLKGFPGDPKNTKWLPDLPNSPVTLWKTLKTICRPLWTFYSVYRFYYWYFCREEGIYMSARTFSRWDHGSVQVAQHFIVYIYFTEVLIFKQLWTSEGNIENDTLNQIFPKRDIRNCCRKSLQWHWKTNWVIQCRIYKSFQLVMMES